MATLLAVGGGEIALGLTETKDGVWPAALRFAAAMSTLCPAMALLGAKRPQDRGWQFIVLSLWAVLSLPAGEWLLFGGVQEIHPARFWFFITLVAIGMLNGLATRYWPSNLLFALGQTSLIAPNVLTAQAWLSTSGAELLGLGLMVSSWTLIALEWPRGTQPLEPVDRLWLDFRDAFGVVWGLRLMQRVDATAALAHWPISLTWRGLRVDDAAQPDPAAEAGVEETLRTLLRRFVSPEWINERFDCHRPAGWNSSAPVSAR